jgi:hypothetical protein
MRVWGRKTPTNFLGREKFLFISRSCGNCGWLNQANNKGRRESFKKHTTNIRTYKDRGETEEDTAGH